MSFTLNFGRNWNGLA